jgi:hypothetical protein
LPSLKSVKKKADKIYDRGKLEKAYVIFYKKSGKSYKVNKKIKVQFNPSEYSIRRGVTHSKKRALGRDNSSANIQTVAAEPSVLTLSLYFDSYTEMKSEQGAVNYMKTTAADYLRGSFNLNKPDFMPSFDMNEDLAPKPDYSVNRCFDRFLEMIKYDHEEHEPPQIGFLWGDSLFFVGRAASHSAQYTVFDRDGTPVRVKLEMTIVGEDVPFDNALYPFESPDRTKQRTLRYGDRLWMMAQEEYGDPAHWKTIAEANGILNPRQMGAAARLKVPSIR